MSMRAGHGIKATLIVMLTLSGVKANAQDVLSSDAAERLNPLSVFDPASLTGFLDRPLFSESRTTPQPAPISAEVSSSADPTPDIKLIGITRTPSGLIARIVDLTSGLTTALRDGDELHGWRIGLSTTSSLVLTRDSRNIGFDVFAKAPAGKAPLLDATTSTAEIPSDASRAVRVIPGLANAPDEAASDPATQSQWTAKDITDVFGAKSNDQ